MEISDVVGRIGNLEKDGEERDEILARMENALRDSIRKADLEHVESIAARALATAEEAKVDVNNLGHKVRFVTAVAVGEDVAQEGGVRGAMRKHERETDLFRLEYAQWQKQITETFGELRDSIKTQSDSVQKAFGRRDKTFVGVALALGALFNIPVIVNVVKAIKGALP